MYFHHFQSFLNQDKSYLAALLYFFLAKQQSAPMYVHVCYERWHEWSHVNIVRGATSEELPHSSCFLYLLNRTKPPISQEVSNYTKSLFVRTEEIGLWQWPNPKPVNEVQIWPSAWWPNVLFGGISKVMLRDWSCLYCNLLSTVLLWGL